MRIRPEDRFEGTGYLYLSKYVASFRICISSKTLIKPRSSGLSLHSTSIFSSFRAYSTWPGYRDLPSCGHFRVHSPVLSLKTLLQARKFRPSELDGGLVPGSTRLINLTETRNTHFWNSSTQNGAILSLSPRANLKALNQFGDILSLPFTT